MMVKVIKKQLAGSIFGLAILLLAGPAASAEVHCKPFIDNFNECAQHQGKGKKYAAQTLNLLDKAIDELDVGQRNEVRKVVDEVLDNEGETFIFPASIDQFCVTAGGDSPLRDAVVKTVHQYQERHRR